MKAILVIDVPVSLEKLIGEKVGMHIFMESSAYVMTEYSTLIQMPEKMLPVLAEGDWFIKGCIHGWNNCIDVVRGAKK